jgi:hypothetical protein
MVMQQCAKPFKTRVLEDERMDNIFQLIMSLAIILSQFDQALINPKA